MEFVHIITTRFNVPTKEWTLTRTGKSPLSEEWHEHRFELFQNYTLASFKNQSVQNFIWLVFFDINTAPKYKKIIQSIQDNYPSFKPVFIEHGEKINSAVFELFPKYFERETKFVISTDIDNDDVLHKDFVKIVQQHYKPLHNNVIDLRRGYQMTIENENKVYFNEFFGVANPFVSITEDIHQMKTIMNERHKNYRHYPNISFYDQKPLFIQIIHSNNLMNNTYNTKRITKIKLQDFGIHLPLKISLFNSYFYNLKRKLSLIKNIIKGYKNS